MVSVMTLTSVGTSRTLTERTHVDQYVAKQQTFYAAEAGLIQGLTALRSQLSITGQFPTASSSGLLSVVAPVLTNGAKFETYTVTYDLDGNGVADPATQTTLASGQFEGMQATTRAVRITSEVTGLSGINTRLSSIVELSVIPVFQFAIFDHNDLQLEPLTTMTVTGSIFANGDLNLIPIAGLAIDGKVSAAGDILHSGSSNTGYVRIKDSAGVYQNMRNADNSWLESIDANWASESQSRWDGKVSDHVAPLSFPVPEGENTIEMIKLGQVGDSASLQEFRLYYQADIRIINGVATDANGNMISLPVGTVCSGAFYDQREEEDICTKEIDISKLNSSGLVNGKVVYIGSTLANGAGCKNAVRLINGSKLPTGGLTIVTHQPLYVKGDYNYSTEAGYTAQPAALIGDALTALSSRWDDNKGDNPMTSRKASNMRLHAAVMAGRAIHSATGSEHMIRFLEHWSGNTFTYTGAEVSPWESDEATSDLAYQAYMPPVRVWTFDSNFLTGSPPPGTPVIYTLTNAVWYQE